jgi:hypothetical protein
MVLSRLLLNGKQVRTYATTSSRKFKLHFARRCCKSCADIWRAVGSLLTSLRAKTQGAARVTLGLSDQLLDRFSANKDLIGAVQDAHAVVDSLIREHGL